MRKRVWFVFGIFPMLVGCMAGEVSGPGSPDPVETRPTPRPFVPRLPGSGGSGSLALVLADGSSFRDAIRDLRRSGNRVLAAVPPRTLVLEADASGIPALHSAFPGASVALSPDDPILHRLPASERASVALFLSPPPPAGPRFDVVQERPPTLPRPEALVTFAAEPRNNVMEFLRGIVVVAVILPESTGAIDPKTETWTDETVAQIKAKVSEGVMRFLDYDPTGDVTFLLHYESANPAGPADTVACGYETVNYSSWMYGNDAIPWSDVLGRLGFPAGQGGPPYVAYLNHLRDFYGADWAFLIKVVNESNAVAGGIPGNIPHADIQGPTTTIYSTNGSEVITHELGHIFGALDEYCNPSMVCPEPTARIGYLGVVNANATGQAGVGHASGFGEQAPSLMSFNDVHHINPYTMQAWGFSDSDGDGIQDVDSMFPDTEISDAEAEEDGGLRVEGTARVLPLATVFAKPPGSSLREIAAVECRVDGNAWQPAAPADGAFDSGEEAFRCPWTRVPAGLHAVESRAIDDQGKVERSPARRWIHVTDSVLVEMPLFASLKAIPETASVGMAVRLDASASSGVSEGMSFRFDLDGDGTLETGPSPDPIRFVTASVPGTHEAGVEVSAPGKEPDLAIVRWHVVGADLPPIAKMQMPGGDRRFGTAEPVFVFDASGSADPEGSPLSFRWQIEGDDESVDTGFGPDATYDYRPTLIGAFSWNSLYTPQKVSIQTVDLSGNLLLTADDSFGLHVVSLAAPDTPTLVGTMSIPAGPEGTPGVWDIAWIGTDRALAVGPGGTFVVDLSNPAAPQVSASTTAIRGIIGRTSGSTGYVGGAEGLVVVNLSDPAVVVPGSVLTTAKVGLLEVVGKWAFLQAGGPMTLLDLTDPLHPVSAATLLELTDRAVQVTGTRGYAWDFEGHVTVFDPAALPGWKVVGAFDLGSAVPRWFDESRVFADRADTLEIRDLTDPSHPVLLGRGVPFAGISQVRSLGPEWIVSAFMGLVQTTRWADVGFNRSIGVRATVTVRDGAGQESAARAYAWANPYDSPPAVEVAVDPPDARGKPGTVFSFLLTMSDPDLGTSWDGLLSWRADLDGDGNWEGPFVELPPGVTTASTSVLLPVPGTYDAVFEVSDRFRAVAREVVRVTVDGPEAPALSGLDPDSSAPEVEEWIEIRGASLDIPLDSLSLGPGVEILAAQSLDPGLLRARIRVSADAVLGPRDVSATFSDGSVAELSGGFAIVPCAIQVQPDTRLDVLRNTMAKFTAFGGASPRFEADGMLESWGMLQSDGLYTSGPKTGVDRMKVRSLACCDAAGQAYEDCRPTRVTVRVRPGDPDRIIRYVSSPGGAAAGGDTQGWTGIAHVADISRISDVWLFLWLDGAPLDALSGTLVSPSQTKIALLPPTTPVGGTVLFGWAPFAWTPKESLEALNGEDPRGDWTLSVVNGLAGSAVNIVQWTLAIAGPEAFGSWDWQPPAAVTDLAVAWVEGQGVILSWTAPADPPGGRPVDHYEIRYAGEPLKYWNWFTTGTVVVHASPAYPGNPDAFLFEVPEPGTWWFGIRAVDANANLGPISNMAFLEIPFPVEIEEPNPDVPEPGLDTDEPPEDEAAGQDTETSGTEDTDVDGTVPPSDGGLDVPSEPGVVSESCEQSIPHSDPHSEAAKNLSDGCGCRIEQEGEGSVGPDLLLGLLLIWVAMTRARSGKSSQVD